MDTIPPGPISDLQTNNINTNSITLTWSAPGDDGASSGIASSYAIRYSASAPPSQWQDSSSQARDQALFSWWSQAVSVQGVSSPASPNTVEVLTVFNLSPNTTYYFGIKTSDEIPNTSFISNMRSITTLQTATPADITPPSVIKDLNYKNLGEGEVTLTWSAPGDDGDIGKATSYDIRYYSSFISNENWASTTQVTGEPLPSAVQTKEEFKVTGLSPGTPYYFGIKTSDEAPNTSSVSNIAYFTTLPRTSGNTGPPPAPATLSGGGGGGGGGGGSFTAVPADIAPPVQVSNLTSEGADHQVLLTWQNPKDGDFVRLIILRKEDSLSNSIKDGRLVYEGNKEEFLDVNLENDKQYYYTVYAYDRASNYSKSATTLVKTVKGKTAFQIQKVSKEIPLSEISGTVQIPLSRRMTIPKDYFERNLSLSDKGDDVRKLQEILYLDKEEYYEECKILENSALQASICSQERLVTGYFGLTTRKALIKFQEKYKDDILKPYNLEKGTGYFGTSTIKKMAEIYGVGAGQALSLPVGGSGQTAQTTAGDQQQLVLQLEGQVKQLRVQLLQLLNQLISLLKQKLGEKEK